jgi:hypothetical protein
MPVGTIVYRDGKRGEVVKHLTTRAMVLWDGEYDALVEDPALLMITA